MSDFTAARARHGDEGGIISVEFSAAVQQGRVMGTQFHPEKSGQVGLQMLKNFGELKNAKNEEGAVYAG